MKIVVLLLFQHNYYIHFSITMSESRLSRIMHEDENWFPSYPSPSLSQKSSKNDVGKEKNGLQRSDSKSTASPSNRKRPAGRGLTRMLSNRASGSTQSVRVNFVAESFTAETPVLSSPASLSAGIFPGVQSPKVVKAGVPHYCEFPNVIDPFAVSIRTLYNRQFIALIC